MSAGLFWMNLAAGDTSTKYPSNGIGGAVVAEGPPATYLSIYKSGVGYRQFRVLGIVVHTSDAAACTFTLKDSAGNTITTITMAASFTSGSVFPLPLYAGKTVALSGTQHLVPLTADGGGIQVDRAFQCSKSNSAWAIDVIFVFD